MRRKFLLVHNPIAGVAGRRLSDRVVVALRARGATVVAAATGASGPDLSVLEREPFDAALAAGGDGTFRALAKVLGTRLPIGFLPMGTGNVLAHEIGLPRGAEAIVEVFMHGPSIAIDGARVNGEPFYLMAGAGFDGDVIGALSTPLKRKIGKAAYVGPVLSALARASTPLNVSIDGLEYTAGWVVVAKARRYGGSFVIAPKAGIASPGLIAVLFKSTSRLVRVRQLMAVGTRLVTHDPAIEMIACKNVRVSCDVPQAVEIDGDAFGETPLQISDGGSPAHLIVPASYAAA